MHPLPPHGVTDTALLNFVRPRREAAGLSQSALAQRVGVARQTLIAIEASTQVPSTAIALQLAAVLGCRVEDLFAVAGAGHVVAETPASGPNAVLHPGRRVKLVRMGHGWVAHPLVAAVAAADGVVVRSRGTNVEVEPLVDPSLLEGDVVVAGCAPLLGPLVARTGASPRHGRATWVSCNSERALKWLAAGHVHVAGLHLSARAQSEPNLAAVRKQFGGRRMLVVHLTRWRQGIVVERGNPRGLRSAGDLSRPGLRLVRREPGSGAGQLLARALRGAGKGAVKPGMVVEDHSSVAALIRAGAADAGIAVESVAMDAELDFVPLVEERFDLVLTPESAQLRQVALLLDTLTSGAFRREAQSLGGYDCSMAGQSTTVGAE